MSDSNSAECLNLSVASREIYGDVPSRMRDLEGPFVPLEDYLAIMADLQRRCAAQADVAIANEIANEDAATTGDGTVHGAQSRPA